MSSSRSYRSRRREPESGGLDNFRVLEQCRPTPTDTPALPQSSRTFRVAAFAFHTGLSMLESRRGREALVQLVSASWRVSSARARRTFVSRDTFQSGTDVADEFVGNFLRKCRSDPPNIIVSDRITGDGLAQRVAWPEVLGSNLSDYNPKWAALFRINKTVVNNAVLAAGAGNTGELQKFLFLLSISIAHELVHLLMGFMFGDPGRLTPPTINQPPGAPNSEAGGESGRYWEAKFFGCIVEAYFDSNNTLGLSQAGDLHGTVGELRGFKIQSSQIQRYLQLDFSSRLCDRDTRTQRIRASVRPMEDVRQPSRNPDFEGSLDTYFQMINGFARERVGRSTLEEIMRMPTRPDLVRPSVPVR